MLPFSLLCLLGVMCLVGLPAVFSVRKELRQDQPEVYEQLFRSSLRITNDLRFSVFLLSGSYGKNVGGLLKKKMDALRLFTFAYLIVLVATFVAFARQ